MDSSAPVVEKKSGPVTVATEIVSSRPVQRTVTVTGSLYGREEVVISPKVEGHVLLIHHDVGDEVKSGDVLLELDTTDAQLSVNEAQKALELELSKLGLKTPPAENFDVSTLPAIARAAVKDKQASSKYERTREAGRAITANDLEQLEYEARDAAEAYRQAKLDAQTTLASVRQRQAALNTAQQRLKDTRVLVPTPKTLMSSLPSSESPQSVTYVVAQRNVSEGEIVRPGSTTLFRLVIADTLKLQAAVPERYLGSVKVGQSVDLQVEAYPKEKFAGTVVRVNPTVDRASRTFQVEVSVPNNNRRLASGSFAKAEVKTRLDNEASLVPEEALVQFAGVTKVFVVRNDKAVAVTVQTTDIRVENGAKGRTKVLAEITGEVHVGDRIVTSGQSKLVDGAAVQIHQSKEEVK